jgi:hypothetical protein
MRLWRLLAVAACFVGGVSAASAQAVSVQSLISQDFVVVGTFLSPAGAALFLQKKDKLFFCVVAETPTSENVDTRYCKPVR